ncbi:hypothetical protein ACFSJU_01955 [Paradesertivirga mongoliensis]|uniref:Cohesin domain-containing protein n=1 Tax=Paradesertivirga mongoliensis TaxID=2100740 RepID=A0ABW4ZGI6_9SPHI|nr:hypothetical protein [Pedobacter mongoliensis]
MLKSILKKSFFIRQVALLLIVSVLCMSFNMTADGVVINAGTSVALETASTISSATITPGQIIDFKVKYDVKVGDKVVIAAGSPAKGQVLRAQKAKGLGKEGLIEIQLKSVKAVDGQDLPLGMGNVFQEGESKETLSIILGIAVCILFLTMKGKDAMVPAGYEAAASIAVTSTVEVK